MSWKWSKNGWKRGNITFNPIQSGVQIGNRAWVNCVEVQSTMPLTTQPATHLEDTCGNTIPSSQHTSPGHPLSYPGVSIVLQSSESQGLWRMLHHDHFRIFKWKWNTSGRGVVITFYISNWSTQMNILSLVQSALVYYCGTLVVILVFDTNTWGSSVEWHKMGTSEEVVKQKNGDP